MQIEIKRIAKLYKNKKNIEDILLLKNQLEKPFDAEFQSLKKNSHQNCKFSHKVLELYYFYLSNAFHNERTLLYSRKCSNAPSPI